MKKNNVKRHIAVFASIVVLFSCCAPIFVSAEAPSLTAFFPAEEFWNLSNTNFGFRVGNGMIYSRYPFSPSVVSTNYTTDQFPHPSFQGYLYTSQRFSESDTILQYGGHPGVIVTGSFLPGMSIASVDSYIYMEFLKAFQIPKGQQIEFYVSCFDNTFIDNDTSSGPQYIYFNYVSNVTPGSFPADPATPWQPTPGIEVLIERDVFDTQHFSRVSNMTRVILRNTSSNIVSITGMQFQLRESSSKGEPIPTTGIHNIGVNRSDLGLLLSPVLRYRFSRNDQVMDDLGDWLDMTNVNIGPDGNVLPRPGYNAGELSGEEEALEMYDYLANMFEADVLDAAREGNQLWTDIFESVYAIPCIVLFSGAGIIFVMTRALIGR